MSMELEAPHTTEISRALLSRLINRLHLSGPVPAGAARTDAISDQPNCGS